MTDDDELIVGYAAAAAYLGIATSTLSAYASRRTGPRPLPKRKARGQYNMIVFQRSELDRWKTSRHHGKRTERDRT